MSCRVPFINPKFVKFEVSFILNPFASRRHTIVFSASNSSHTGPACENNFSRHLYNSLVIGSQSRCRSLFRATSDYHCYYSQKSLPLWGSCELRKLSFALVRSSSSSHHIRLTSFPVYPSRLDVRLLTPNINRFKLAFSGRSCLRWLQIERSEIYSRKSDTEPKLVRRLVSNCTSRSIRNHEMSVSASATVLNKQS